MQMLTFVTARLEMLFPTPIPFAPPWACVMVIKYVPDHENHTHHGPYRGQSMPNGFWDSNARAYVGCGTHILADDVLVVTCAVLLCGCQTLHNYYDYDKQYSQWTHAPLPMQKLWPGSRATVEENGLRNHGQTPLSSRTLISRPQGWPCGVFGARSVGGSDPGLYPSSPCS